uniref:ribonuclease H n=1 Tax=Serratia phage Kevin TaxID=3161161 RepID=A0AAU8KXZ5_9CAUD
MIEIYSDGGSFPQTTKAAGWAFAIAPQQQEGQWRVFFGHLPPPSTNNIAEMLGTLNAMRFMYHFHLKTGQRLPPVTIVSDSQYVIKGITEYRFKWEREGGWPLKNNQHWCDIFDVFYKLREVCDLNFKWVYGHVGIQGNEIADQWATHAKNDSNFCINTPRLVSKKVVGDFTSFLAETGR